VHFVGEKGLSGLDIVAYLVSAAVHDLGHPGGNSDNLVDMGDIRALVFNAKSVLENMHAMNAFLLFMNPAVSWLSFAYKTQEYYTDSGFEFNTLFYTSYIVDIKRLLLELLNLFPATRRPGGQVNFLSNLEEGQFKSFRKKVVSLVLSTDMAAHATVMGNFQVRRLDEDWLGDNTHCRAAPPP
jgi:hypothetical protein